MFNRAVKAHLLEMLNKHLANFCVFMCFWKSFYLVCGPKLKFASCCAPLTKQTLHWTHFPSCIAIYRLVRCVRLLDHPKRPAPEFIFNRSGSGSLRAIVLVHIRARCPKQTEPRENTHQVPKQTPRMSQVWKRPYKLCTDDDGQSFKMDKWPNKKMLNDEIWRWDWDMSVVLMMKVRTHYSFNQFSPFSR